MPVDNSWSTEQDRHQAQGRQQMADNTSQLVSQHLYIDRIMDNIVETHKVADDVLIELPQQTETIRRQTDQVSRIGDNVQHARSIVGRMSNRQIIQSVLLVAIIGIVSFIILVLFLLVIRSNFSRTNE